MEGRLYARPVAEQAQGAVADIDELRMLAAEPGPLSKEAGKEGLLGGCLLTWTQGYLGAAYRHGSKASFLHLGSLGTSFLRGRHCCRKMKLH